MTQLAAVSRQVKSEPNAVIAQLFLEGKDLRLDADPDLKPKVISSKLLQAELTRLLKK